ncbi:MAG: hypothetical protein F6K19_26410 [Cyanothece sp. SIO1E1]|nr:hypothetical protein [Cyanothece sp. SIO1E1]
MNDLKSGSTDTKYEVEQRYFWQQLHWELERFKSELGATNVELAKGLNISRQPLVSFMQDPTQRGLPIHRANLIQLWDHLTDASLIRRKKLSEAARRKRCQLKQEGPKRLLEAAGFLHQANCQGRSTRRQQIQRLAAMLESLPDIGFASFNNLINDLEVSVKARAFPYDHPMARSQGKAPEIYPLAIEKRIENIFSDPLKSAILERKIFNQITRRLAIASSAGNYELSDAELFELGLCVLNHEQLNRQLDRHLKIEVTECQFKVLTFSLPQYFSECDREIENAFTQAALETEQLLHQRGGQAHLDLKSGLTDLDLAEVPSVMEVEIRCKFTELHQEISFLYRSSATHIENVLAAMALGMGYSAHLEQIESSTQTLSQKDYGLVKATTAFRARLNDGDINDGDIYESFWVDRSTIKAILQSSLNAAKKWLSDQLQHREAYAAYYQVCCAIAEIESNLAQRRKLLNDYAFRLGKSGHRSAKLHLTQAVIEKVKYLQVNVLAHHAGLRECYGAYLERQLCIAYLTCARLAHVEGNLIEAKQFLTQVKHSLEAAHLMQACVEIRILYEIEAKLDQFFSGDPAFFTKRAWQSDLKFWLHDVSQYISEAKLEYGKYPDRFDFNTYLCAAEIFGRMSRLTLCCCDSGDAALLGASVQQSLRAAYCASKIGYQQRTAHWLVNASRIYCRLGDNNQSAEQLCQVATRIITHALEPIYSEQYVASIMAEVELANGERLLLVEQDSPSAINHFLAALQGAIYIGFARLIADALYGIARAAKGLSNYRVSKSMAAAFEVDAYANLLDETKQGWDESSIAAEVIEFLNRLDKNCDWNTVSEQFRFEAKKIWQRWFSETHPGKVGLHPIAAMIDQDLYLGKIELT